MILRFWSEEFWDIKLLTSFLKRKNTCECYYYLRVLFLYNYNLTAGKFTISSTSNQVFFTFFMKLMVPNRKTQIK